mmetsp:Transcript_63325/g.125181  ORF Transcript_63325/g.125181 Transcript_63325/m.125181 type:complete len:171 (-) Transcript_63325:158-670(-)
MWTDDDKSPTATAEPHRRADSACGRRGECNGAPGGGVATKSGGMAGEGAGAKSRAAGSTGDARCVGAGRECAVVRGLYRGESPAAHAVPGVTFFFGGVWYWYTRRRRAYCGKNWLSAESSLPVLSLAELGRGGGNGASMSEGVRDDAAGADEGRVRALLGGVICGGGPCP